MLKFDDLGVAILCFYRLAPLMDTPVQDRLGLQKPHYGWCHFEFYGGERDFVAPVPDPPY
jgi:hypothetical protein